MIVEVRAFGKRPRAQAAFERIEYAPAGVALIDHRGHGWCLALIGEIGDVSATLQRLNLTEDPGEKIKLTKPQRVALLRFAKRASEGEIPDVNYDESKSIMLDDDDA